MLLTRKATGATNSKYHRDANALRCSKCVVESAKNGNDTPQEGGSVVGVERLSPGPHLVAGAVEGLEVVLDERVHNGPLRQLDVLFDDVAELRHEAVTRVDEHHVVRGVAPVLNMFMLKDANEEEKARCRLGVD